MQLIGMLDSPYVRRVAVAMIAAGVPFEHKPISLFRHIDAFSAINPVLKAPTLVTDGGVTLMDSTLILDYLLATRPAMRALTPQDPADLSRALASRRPRARGHGEGGAAPLRARAASAGEEPSALDRPRDRPAPCGLRGARSRAAAFRFLVRKLEPRGHCGRLRLHLRRRGRRRSGRPCAVSEPCRLHRPRRSAARLPRRSGERRRNRPACRLRGAPKRLAPRRNRGIRAGPDVTRALQGGSLSPPRNHGGRC